MVGKISAKEVYKAMAKNAVEDAALYKDVEYDGEEEYVSIEKTKDGIEVFDATDAPFERSYTITKPEKMTLTWLQNRIVATPSAIALGVNADAVARWIHKYMPKHIYSTLRYLVITGGRDLEGDIEDQEYLWGVDDFFREAFEEHGLPDEHLLGINWYSANVCVVSFGHILNSAESIRDRDGDWYAGEFDRFVNEGLATTIAHEFRHLAQSNPYIPAEIFGGSGSIEDDAEDFAVDFFEAHPMYLLAS